MEKKTHTGGRKKGDGKGKTGGRKVGSQNKVTREAKEILATIVDNNAEKAQKMLDMIVEPKDWVQCFIKLAEFVVPKKAAVSMSAEVKKSDLRSELSELAQSEID